MLNKDIGKFMFWLRSYLPFPLALIMVILARPTTLNFLVGLAIILTGKGIRIWAAGYIGDDVLGATTETAPPTLVTTGPYAHIRNPLYVGNFFICLGACIMSNINWIIYPIFLVLFIFLYWNIVLFEERVLQRKFDEEFEDYRKTVSRIIPKLRGFSKASVHKFNFKRAMKYESISSLAIIWLIVLIILKALL